MRLPLGELTGAAIGRNRARLAQQRFWSPIDFLQSVGFDSFAGWIWNPSIGSKKGATSLRTEPTPTPHRGRPLLPLKETQVPLAGIQVLMSLCFCVVERSFQLAQPKQQKEPSLLSSPRQPVVTGQLLI